MNDKKEIDVKKTRKTAILNGIISLLNLGGSLVVSGTLSIIHLVFGIVCGCVSIFCFTALHENKKKLR